MANHTGFVFISPDGKYLRRSSYMGHGNYSFSFTLAHSLDAATLFPASSLGEPTENEDWESIKYKAKDLIPLPAKSFQRIELRVQPE